MTPALTIGITTRNRRDALRACVASVGAIAGVPLEILVFDDRSDEPAAQQIGDLPDGGIRIIRDERAPGYIVGRNRLVQEARAPMVLLLDDDTRILDGAAVGHAMAVLNADPHVAAIAFAQAEADGRPWPPAMQPSPSTTPVVVRSYIGFAHLVRRDAFLALGGYREALVAVGEEKELCLRLLDAGYQTVYLPGSRIAHLPDPRSRDRQRHLRHLVRSDCLNALFNEPFDRVIWMVPARYALYFRMRRGWSVDDPWGWVWIAREVLASVPAVRTGRKPVSRSTVRRWKELRTREEPYNSMVIAATAASEHG